MSSPASTMPALLVALCLTVGLSAGCGGDGSGPGAGSSPASPITTEPTPSEPAPAGPTISGASCLAPGNGTKSIRFAEDNRLASYLMGTGVRFVILAHQSDGDACQMWELGARLAAAGYRVLAFDFAGNGRSRPPSGGGSQVAADLTDAVVYSRDRGARSIAAIGASMGGLAALAAGTRLRSPLDAVVALSAPNEFGTEQVPSLRGFPSPLQVYVAGDDSYFAGDALFAQIKQFLDANLR